MSETHSGSSGRVNVGGKLLPDGSIVGGTWLEVGDWEILAGDPSKPAPRGLMSAAKPKAKPPTLQSYRPRWMKNLGIAR